MVYQESYQRTLLSLQNPSNPAAMVSSSGILVAHFATMCDVTTGNYRVLSPADIPVETSSDAHARQEMQLLTWRQQETSNGSHLYNQEARTAFDQRESVFREEAQRFEVIAYEGSENRLRAAAITLPFEQRAKQNVS